jgi:hypothetical protein
MNDATVWRVDLDTDEGTWRTREQIRCSSAEAAELLYANNVQYPSSKYATVSLVFDCRLVRKQMLHGDQEFIS